MDLLLEIRYPILNVMIPLQILVTAILKNETITSYLKSS
jgi:hypothetical protein